jgi:poly(3-hydroxybutyrate) depolymerase
MTGANDTLRQWTDSVDGQQRAACVFTPTGASAASPRPLLIWLGGTGQGAGDVYHTTSLRTKAPSYDLTGDSSRPGFFLIADQPRNIYLASPPHQENEWGSERDWFYRDLSTATRSADLRAVDRLIDDFVATGAVDPKRIYMTGYSNGAFTGMLYTIARYSTPDAGREQHCCVGHLRWLQSTR